jgi:phospholipid/cholesterol/gamma-HCH transport system permease protein
MKEHQHERDSFVTVVGHNAVAVLDYVGNLSIFLAQAAHSLLFPPWYFREVINQMYYLGVKSLSLVMVASFALGMVMGLQGYQALTPFGAGMYMATLVSMSTCRELGPIIAGIILAARGGAGMGAELGSMRVTSQIDSLTVSAVSPMKYLVITRILACTLALPLIAVFADIFGMLGGLVVAIGQVGMPANTYYYLTVKYMSLSDLLPGILKTVIFGLIIGTVSCYHGFTTEKGTFGVGMATRTSVVASILLILVSDVFLTKITLIIWG